MGSGVVRSYRRAFSANAGTDGEEPATPSRGGGVGQGSAVGAGGALIGINGNEKETRRERIRRERKGSVNG